MDFFDDDGEFIQPVTIVDEEVVHAAINQLILHEGMREKPYQCTAGKTTIGVGRNLDDVGVSEDEAMYLLHNDMVGTVRELVAVYPGFSDQLPARQVALIDFVFNLGITRARKFKKFWNAMNCGDYLQASKELLLNGAGDGPSKYAQDVGQRAWRVAGQIRTGRFDVEQVEDPC